MALIFMDGFDSFSSAADLYALAYAGSNIKFSTTGGRFGGGALSMDGGGEQAVAGIQNMPLEIWMGFAIKHADNTSQDKILCCVSSPVQVEASLTYNPSTGQFRMWRGQTNGYLAGAAVLMPAGDWHWIDLRVKYDNGSNGAMELWLDGTQVCAYTGQLSQSGQPATNLASVQIGSIAIGSLNGGFIDDLIVCDTTGTVNNGRIGDHRIETLQPTADAGTNNGTPSTAGAHYAMVADVGWDPSTYVTLANTAGQEELYSVSDLAGNPASVSAVKVTHVSQKTNTEDANLKTVIVSGGSESDGPTAALGTAWTKFGTILENDPHTNAAWTGAAINALQAGVKVA